MVDIDVIRGAEEEWMLADLPDEVMREWYKKYHSVNYAIGKCFHCGQLTGLGSAKYCYNHCCNCTCEDRREPFNLPKKSYKAQLKETNK